jgi:hypothetical protein
LRRRKTALAVSIEAIQILEAEHMSYRRAAATGGRGLTEL